MRRHTQETTAPMMMEQEARFLLERVVYDLGLVVTGAELEAVAWIEVSLKGRMVGEGLLKKKLVCRYLTQESKFAQASVTLPNYLGDT